MFTVRMYTDGACTHNPHGPGGYGVVLLTTIDGEAYRKEFSGGFANTTNNRMELMAVAVGLEMLKKPCSVEIFSDSQYIVKSMNLGWTERWKRNGWYKSKTSQKRPANIDLWKRILKAAENHEVTFTWVKGHSGIEENERCDYLATTAANGTDLPPDLDEGDEEEPRLF